MGKGKEMGISGGVREHKQRLRGRKLCQALNWPGWYGRRDWLGAKLQRILTLTEQLGLEFELVRSM